MYKDLLFPKTENNTCTFSPVSFAHRGEYWCVAGNDTALYSNPVDIRVSDRLVFGLGAAPLLLVTIILCVKCCRKPGSSNEAAVRYTEENVEFHL
ncbi:hypothetical protein SKAU_G00275650 [Synaphobranchus kaupii]|uniref:Uncharacterized protein n=1 Tax=Synaphobranchus kaupii TaxID=118154 RepID=A0A9Q1IR15_SYNKA|nr:hypothetical protein SKAU_G00275650 [Synaphobranchus kaupii]